MLDCTYIYGGLRRSPNPCTEFKNTFGQAHVEVYRRKMNQSKGEAEGKRKAKGDEIVREMYGFLPVVERGNIT